MNATWMEELAEASARAVEQAQRSLVTVEARGAGVGSGVHWAHGWVVTNAHVARTKRLRIRRGEGEAILATVRAHDPGLDLALLEVDGDLGERALVGDSTQLRVGEWVFAVGHPWGVRGAATGGIVIDPAAGPRGDWLALGLHLRPGHSGGAVVNVRGEVVGINTMMNGPDVGVAIAAATVKRFLAESGLRREMGQLDRAA
jgi:S1-C subfamily serine protease